MCTYAHLPQEVSFYMISMPDFESEESEYKVEEECEDQWAPLIDED